MPNFEKPRNNRPIENDGQYHLACAVVIDTSSSCAPFKNEIEKGVETLINTIKDDEVASERVEIMLIGYDDNVSVISPFGPVYGIEVPHLDCGGMTHMHEAVAVAMEQIEKRKAEYKAAGTPYYRPWIFVLTDGKPNDANHGEFEQLIKAQELNKTTFFGVGMGSDADIDLLKSLNKDGICLSATSDEYKGVFQWLSDSLSKTGTSTPEAEVELSNPADFGQIRIIS